MQYLSNKIQTPDGTILESFHRHDYKTYTDTNGEVYMVDGGISYLRRSINKEPYIELSVTTESPFELIRKEFTWGTYGINGDQPLVRKPLEILDTDHIEAIINTQFQLPDYIIQVFYKELLVRKNVLVI